MPQSGPPALRLPHPPWRFVSPKDTSRVRTVPTSNFQLEVDWYGDSRFGGQYDDISHDWWGTAQTRRGKETASNLTARAVAGTLQVDLNNFNGKYSSFNTNSPLYGLIKPGRRVRLWSNLPYRQVLWTGVLSHIDPKAGGIPSATLYATGIFTQLGDQTNQVSPLPQTNVNTGVVMGAILDAAGNSSTDRTLDTGYVPVGNWFISDKVALQALQEIEETETGGFIYEGLAFDFIFEDRYHRLLNSNGAVSQATFSDEPTGALPYIALEQVDPLQEIYNELTATVQPYTAQALAVLWALADVPIVLAPGESRTYIATYQSGYVNPWTTPVIGTDIVQTGVSNGDIGISASPASTAMPITLTNNNLTTNATLTTVQARGVAYMTGTAYQVKGFDSASQLAYQRRVYPLPGPYYPNQPYAQAACDYFVSIKKDPHPMLTMTIPAASSDALFYQAVTRRISDRITVVATGLLTKLGVNQDFFIEGISHNLLMPHGPLETTFLLSPASVQAPYLQFDVGRFDVDRFGY